jgi:hypothetical protein
VAHVVRLQVPDGLSNIQSLRGILSELEELTERPRLTLAVVLKGNWIIDENGEALDGNNLWSGVPGVRSGNGAQGDDWVSLIHIVRDIEEFFRR